MNVLKPLQGFDSETNAYLVKDYPYGFTLRCEIRYWIETKKGFGQRFCSQTLNPKTGKWNTPKKGRYCTVIGMGLDEKDYVTTAHLQPYSTKEEVDTFEKVFTPLTERQAKIIGYIREYLAKQEAKAEAERISEKLFNNSY